MRSRRRYYFLQPLSDAVFDAWLDAIVSAPDDARTSCYLSEVSKLGYAVTNGLSIVRHALLHAADLIGARKPSDS